MDTLVDNSEQQLIERIRLEREARGWSIAALAEKSGVSKAAISKIERSEASPTAGNLVRLATAFDLTLAGLLVRAEAPADRVSRADTQHCWTDPATGYRRRQVYARPDHPVEMVEVTMPAGQSVSHPASSYAHIRQVVWVLDGQLTINEGVTSNTLGPGDCLGFGPPADTQFINETTAQCRYIVALFRN